MAKHALVASIAVAVAAGTEDVYNACSCSGNYGLDWEEVRLEMWQIFREDVDVSGLIVCAANLPLTAGLAPPCTNKAEERSALDLLTGPAFVCSEENLPNVDRRLCPAGMVHYMLVCMMQMWLRGHYRQSALYYENSMGYLSESLDCLEGSKWPLWPGQVLENWRMFLSFAYPPGALHAEERIASGDGGDVPYMTAGPAVDASAFRWANGPRTGLYCPPLREQPPSAGPSGSQRPVAVLCAVPLVWPAEADKAAVIGETYGQACDRVMFFIAAPDEAVAREAAKTLAKLFPAASVVDLAAEWPHMVRDSDAQLFQHGRTAVSGANQKDLLMFAHLAASGALGEPGAVDWVCRVETDSYFAPANFRSFVRARGLDPSSPYFLGSISYWHLHFEPRIVFNEQVQCLSHDAVRRLTAAVLAAPWVQATTYARCEVAPGHRGDMMLALCLAEAGVVPHPDISDQWGREYFLNYRLEDLGMMGPVGTYGQAVADIKRFDTNAMQHWRGKAHVFMPCFSQNTFWASPYPISFHDYKNPDGIRWVHEVITGLRACEPCPEGYVPRLAPG